MGCLNIQIKIAMLIDSMKAAKEMLNDECIRPKTRDRLQEDIDRMHKDLKQLYIDLFKVISN